MSNWTTANIPDQTGRTAVITGANTGLGYETAAALAAKGAHVVLAVRNVDKGNEAATPSNRRHPGADVAVQELDLTSLESVRTAAERAAVHLRHHRPADQQRRRDVHTEVDDQGRLRIAVRHKPSRPLRADRPAARPATGGPVHASSPSAAWAIGSPAESASTICNGNGVQPGRRVRAGQARQPDVHLRTAAPVDGTNTIAAAAHPGGSRTELTRNLPPLVGAVTKLVEPLFQDADMGALPTLRAATDPGVIGGQYFGPDGFGEQRGYPEGRRVEPGIPRRRRSSAGCGRSPKS